MKADVKIFIHSNENRKIFGLGPCLLLREVEKTGSLRKASVKMDMAYTKALRLIKNAEDSSGHKLVETKTGGISGGGSSLTEYAKELLDNYERFNKEVSAFADKTYEEIFNTTK